MTKTEISRPVRVAVIGMGGYAAAHHYASEKLDARGLTKLVAACDPNIEHFAEKRRKWRLQERGVAVYSDYLQMLDSHGDEIDMVVIPTPIFLHAEMHRECVRRGFAVYLEKPPTPDPVELEAMTRDGDSSKFQTQVGFNFIVHRGRRELKRRMINGEFGRILRVTFQGLWPRSETYFQRNQWAGKLMLDDGRLVLDSCFGNAMSHFVHNVLFWAGTREVDDWAQIKTVRAALFRAFDIEGPDTAFVEAVSVGGIPMRLGLTHACVGKLWNREQILCEQATVAVDSCHGTEVAWSDGRKEIHPAEDFDAVTENQANYVAYLNGELPRPATQLCDSRAFVELNALAYCASGSITDFADCGVPVDRMPHEGSFVCAPRGLPEKIERFVASGCWPTEWLPGCGNTLARPADDLPHLRSTLEHLKRSTELREATKAGGSHATVSPSLHNPPRVPGDAPAIHCSGG